MLIAFSDHENIYMYRHQFYDSTIFSFWDIGKSKISSNDGNNLHFLQNAQRCQECIIQFLNLGYIKIRKIQ